MALTTKDLMTDCTVSFYYWASRVSLPVIQPFRTSTLCFSLSAWFSCQVICLFEVPVLLFTTRKHVLFDRLRVKWGRLVKMKFWPHTNRREMAVFLRRQLFSLVSWLKEKACSEQSPSSVTDKQVHDDGGWRSCKIITFMYVWAEATKKKRSGNHQAQGEGASCYHEYHHELLWAAHITMSYYGQRKSWFHCLSFALIGS